MVAFSKLPVMMSDEDVVDKRYENSKIYVVKCKNNPKLKYVGSTIKTLEVRFYDHKYNKNCSLYKYVNGDWDNWSIELYENYPCKNEYHLNRREGEVQREIATINERVAGRTDKEWREDNREKILEQKKQYYQDNREKKLEKAKQYHQNNRDERLEKAKQYRQDNSEKMREYERNRPNKNERNEQQKEKTTCEHCGSIVRKHCISRHKKSQKCINFKPA